MVAFGMLSPHAHNILKAIKNWDHPIGKAVAWFDDAMLSLQEEIGGKQVPEINGNEMKLWLICLLRDKNPQYPDPIDKACQRRRDAPIEKRKQQQAIDGLNQVAELCEKIEENPPVEEVMRHEVLKLCSKFAETLENMVDANAGMILLGEWARAKVLNNEQIEASDEAIAERFIEKGVFGPVTDSITDVREFAVMYLESTSAYNVIEVETDGSLVVLNHDKPPVWTELLEIGASYIPEDKPAVDEALELLENTPFLFEFEREDGDLDMAKRCWTQASLLALQPRRWDRIAAGMVYLESKLLQKNSTLACLACQVPIGYYVLRCGSAIP
jgi:hypothetical protein